jgi:hypothetical protein
VYDTSPRPHPDDGQLATLIDLRKESDDLPNIGARDDRRSPTAWTILEDNPGKLAHPQTFVDELLSDPRRSRPRKSVGSATKSRQDVVIEPN